MDEEGSSSGTGSVPASAVALASMPAYRRQRLLLHVSRTNAELT